MVTESKFLEELADELELESPITMQTAFRDDIEDWSSLMAFSVMAFFSEKYSIEVDPEEFSKLNKISELYDLLK